MATLADAIELIKEGDAQIVERQEEANETLASIDRGIKEFLGLQKRPRLDNLEDKRENKRRLSKLGTGMLMAGGAIGGAALAGASDAMGGERIDPLRMLGGAAAGAVLLKLLKKPIALLGAAIAGLAGVIAEASTRTKSGLKDIEGRSTARVQQIDEAVAKAKKDLSASVDREQKIKVASEEFERNRSAMGSDPRGDYVAQEAEIKRQQQLVQIEKEKTLIQQKISEAEQERMQQERIRDEARDAQTRKSVAERRRRLAALQAQQAEVEANRNDPRGDYTAAEADQRARDVTRARAAAPEVTSTTPEAPRLAANVDEAPRLAANIDKAPRVAPAPITADVYDDAILRQSRGASPKSVPVKGLAQNIARGAGKAAAVVAAPIDVAVSVALGGGAQVERDVAVDKKSTYNEVLAESGKELVGGLATFFVDLPANLANAAIDKAGQFITGDENFTVGRTNVGGYVGDKVREGIVATGIGSETDISQGVAAGLVETKRVITISSDEQKKSMIRTLESRLNTYKQQYESGDITKEQYQSRVESYTSRIQKLRQEIQENQALDTRLQGVYSEPSTNQGRMTAVEAGVKPKMEMVQEIRQGLDATPQNNTIQAVDARTNNNQTNIAVAPASGGGGSSMPIQSYDPTVKDLPGRR